MQNWKSWKQFDRVEEERVEKEGGEQEEVQNDDVYIYIYIYVYTRAALGGQITVPLAAVTPPRGS